MNLKDLYNKLTNRVSQDRKPVTGQISDEAKASSEGRDKSLPLRLIELLEHFLIDGYDIYVDKKEAMSIIGLNNIYKTKFIVMQDPNGRYGRDYRISYNGKFPRDIMVLYSNYRMIEVLNSLDEIRKANDRRT